MNSYFEKKSEVNVPKMGTLALNGLTFKYEVSEMLDDISYYQWNTKKKLSL